jgi:hypothetical protein
MGSPIGTTTGGEFRFTCAVNPAPCKVSIAAAVLSDKGGSALVHARVLIYRETVDEPEIFCEYADGANNSSTPAKISLVPMDTSVLSINDPLNMGIGGSLDCGSGQTSSSGIVQDIEVPSGSSDNAEYDVFTTFAFK